MRFYYTLTNLDPLVISQSSASTNNHECLDYIPGSAMLGAVAARLYPELSPEQAMDMFHNGTCRFGPAYPIKNNQIALPVPASWHGIKNDNAALSNHTAADFIREPDKQYQQRRSGYITSQNETAAVEHSLTTRTAIDPMTQRAKDGQLYSYASIAPNQQFAGWVECDDPTLLALIKPILNGQLSVGRSRSSEFGRVQLQCPSQQPTSSPVTNHKQELVIWCLSDLECKNQYGMPTLAPSAADIHPELKGELNAARSFIRTHKLRRFNRARGGFDTEQQLITRGSVLTFTLETAASQDLLKQLAEQGVGLHRQQGLGWISVNPSWANLSNLETLPLFEAIQISPATPQAIAKAPSTPLLQWVKVQLEHVKSDKDQDKKLKDINQIIFTAYRNARQYNSIPLSHQAGPSASQWRRLADLVRNQDTENWQAAAFVKDPTDKEAVKKSAAICKAHKDELGWGLGWQEEGKTINFADKMKAVLGELSISDMRQLLEDLCRFDLSTRDGFEGFRKAHIATQQGAK